MPMPSKRQMFPNPIPGEHMTTDKSAYRWHKPAQISDFDDTIEYFVDKVLSKKKSIESLVQMAGTGINLVNMVQMIGTTMVMGGVIHPRLALLSAGPMYKLLKDMFDVGGVSYLSGFDTQEEMESFAKKQGLIEDDTIQVPEENVTPELQAEMQETVQEQKEEVKVKGTGLMVEEQEPIAEDLTPLEENEPSESLLEPMEEEEMPSG